MSKLVDHMSRYKRTATELVILGLRRILGTNQLHSTSFPAPIQRECPVCAVEKNILEDSKKKPTSGLCDVMAMGEIGLSLIS